LLTQQVGSASIFPDNPRVRTSTRWLRSVAAIVALLGFAQSPVATGQPQSLVGHAKRHAVVAADAVWHGALDLVVYAFGLIGVAYRFGGESPDDGLDCSGLVRHVVQQITGVTLPRSSKDMSRIGGSVHKTDLAPGDLVFFNTRRFAFSHVGIYVGDNRFIHAPRRGREVEIADLDSSYWKKRYDGARRLVDVAPSPSPTRITTAAWSQPVDAPADEASEAEP